MAIIYRNRENTRINLDLHPAHVLEQLDVWRAAHILGMIEWDDFAARVRGLGYMAKSLNTLIHETGLDAAPRGRERLTILFPIQRKG